MHNLGINKIFKSSNRFLVNVDKQNDLFYTIEKPINNYSNLLKMNEFKQMINDTESLFININSQNKLICRIGDLQNKHTLEINLSSDLRCVPLHIIIKGLSIGSLGYRISNHNRIVYISPRLLGGSGVLSSGKLDNSIRPMALEYLNEGDKFRLLPERNLKFQFNGIRYIILPEVYDGNCGVIAVINALISGGELLDKTYKTLNAGRKAIVNKLELYKNYLENLENTDSFSKKVDIYKQMFSDFINFKFFLINHLSNLLNNKNNNKETNTSINKKIRCLEKINNWDDVKLHSNSLESSINSTINISVAEIFSYQNLNHGFIYADIKDYCYNARRDKNIWFSYNELVIFLLHYNFYMYEYKTSNNLNGTVFTFRKYVMNSNQICHIDIYLYNNGSYDENRRSIIPGSHWQALIINPEQDIELSSFNEDLPKNNIFQTNHINQSNTNLQKTSVVKDKHNSISVKIIANNVLSEIRNRYQLLKLEFVHLRYKPESDEYKFICRIIDAIDLSIDNPTQELIEFLDAIEDLFLKSNDHKANFVYDYLDKTYPDLLINQFKTNLLCSNEAKIEFFTRMTECIESQVITEAQLSSYLNILIEYGDSISDINNFIIPIIYLIRVSEQSNFYLVVLNGVVNQAKGKLQYEIFKEMFANDFLLEYFLNKYPETLNIWHKAIEDNPSLIGYISDILFTMLQNKRCHTFIDLFLGNIKFSPTVVEQIFDILLPQINRFKHKEFLFQRLFNISLKNDRLFYFLSKVWNHISNINELLLQMLSIKLEDFDEIPDIRKLLIKNKSNPFLYKFCNNLQRFDKNLSYYFILPLFLHIIKTVDKYEKMMLNDAIINESYEAVIKSLQLLCAKLNNNCFDKQTKRLLKGLLEFYTTKITNNLTNNTSLNNKLLFLKQFLDSVLYIQLDDIVPVSDMTSRQKVVNLLNEISEYFNIQPHELPQKMNGFHNKLFHFLCKQRYSLNDFKDWIINDNDHLKDELTKIFDKMNEMRTLVEQDREILLRKGYEFIHNNQIAALAIIDKYIETHNIFLKLETGQGKSFVAERAAIKLLKSDARLKRVLILTTYDHLAKRDYEDMKFLSQEHKIKSFYCDFSAKSLELLPMDEQIIIHVDTNYFQQALGNKYMNILLNQLETNEVDNFLKIYNPNESAVILDEGDLILLDDEGLNYTANVSQLFSNLNALNMKTEGKRFKEYFGVEFLKAIDNKFSSAFNTWYSEESNKVNEGTRTKIDPASGKKVTLAENFANKLSQGKFQAINHGFNMVAYISRFKKIIFLSGSIDNKHMNLFDKAFSKPNIFFKLPVFYGSHNRAMNLTSIREVGNLKKEDWNNHIYQDVAEAIKREQPILIFCYDQHISEFKITLEKQFPSKIIQVINDEKNLDMVKDIGKINYITLANIIIGRGVDIKVPKHHKYGLHVIITMLPENNNDRLLHQMKGRTARLDNKGSFSIIVQNNYEDFKIKSLKHDPIASKTEIRRLHQEIITNFIEQFRNIRNAEKRFLIARRWVIFMLVYFDKIRTDNDKSLVNRFITEEVFK